MGGVDLVEQIKQSFSIIRKSNKALKKLFYHGLEVCLLNSFTILKKVKQTPRFPRRKFHLVKGKCFSGQPGRPPTRPAVDMDTRRLNRQYDAISVEEGRRNCCLSKSSFCPET